jgi:phospholipid transport system transporter-binding protein
MIERVQQELGNRWRVTSSMTHAQAAALQLAGDDLFAHIQPRQAVTIDLALVKEADSAGLAVLLGWLRTAEQQGRAISIEGIPAGLRSLAEMYGIAELLNFV